MQKWYKNSKWRNLVDMHISDMSDDLLNRFDPEAYADNMKTAKVDASEYYTGNCLGISFFPTSCGHMHRGLKGRDITALTLGELSKKNLNVIVYFNIWCRWGFDHHPSWRVIDIDGKNSCEADVFGSGRYGVCCPNNEEFRAYIAKQIAYLCDHYEFCGLWIDMIGWFTDVCYCPSCKEKYRRATDRELPEKIDWKDPEWVKFQRMREQWNLEFFHVVDDIARAKKPGITIAYQSAPCLSGWYRGASAQLAMMSDYLAADIYGTPLTSSIICKAMANMSANKPFEYMTSRCVDLTHHTINRSKAEMKFQIYGAIANNAAFTFIDAINPDGTMDHRLYDMMGKLKDDLAPYLQYWRPDAQLQREVVLYTNYNSMFDHTDTDVKKGTYDLSSYFENAAAALIGAHLIYDISTRNTLEEMCDTSKVIILSQTYMIDDEEKALLESFVKKGGSLIVTGLTGMYSQEGFHKDFTLANLTGVHYEGETLEDITYIRPDKQYGYLMPEFNDTYPMSVCKHAVKVRTDDGVRVLARLTLPWGHSLDKDSFACATSNPPYTDTQYPMITVKEYGQGRAMYIAAPIETQKFSAIGDVLVSLIKHMLPAETLFETNAPNWLELYLYRDEDFYQLTLYNAMNAYYVAEAVDVRVKVRLPQKPLSVVNAANGYAVDFTYQNGELSLELGNIETFAMYIIR